MSTIDGLLLLLFVMIAIVLQISIWFTDPLRELRRFYSASRQSGFPSIFNCWIDIQRLAIGEKWRPTFRRHGNYWNLPTISVTPTGLQIAWNFSVLLVPWEEVDIHAIRTRYEVSGSVLMRFQKTRLIALRISDKVLLKALEFGAPFQFDDQGHLARMQ